MKNYLVLSNAKNPKYIFPIYSNKIAEASLKLYLPLTFQRKIQIAILKGLIRTKLIKWFFYKNLVDEKELQLNVKMEKLRSWLRRILRCRKFVFAYFTGTAGLYRKTTIQVMNDEGKILAYVKIADTEHNREKLRNERNILKFLNSLRISSAIIPQVLGVQRNKGQHIIVQSAPRDNLGSISMKLTEKHILFLCETFNKSARHEEFGKSMCFRSTAEKMQKISENLGFVWKERFEKGVTILVRNLASSIIPLGLCHYDFKPWNMRTAENGEKLVIFDWELAKENWVPFWDIFHFIIQPLILAKRRNAQEIFNILTSPDTYHRKLFDNYTYSIKLNSGLYKYMLLFYLCDVGSFYWSKQFMVNEKDTSEDLLIGETGKLLDLCINWIGA
jgi:hypothetical protein